MPDISLLIPWRTDNGLRQRIWDWARPRWEKSGFEICIGVDDGERPFNISRAYNGARSQATGDVLVTMGADEIPSPAHIRAVVDQHSELPWASCFEGRYVLNPRGNEALLAGRPLNRRIHIKQYRPRCFSYVMIQPDVWNDIRGWDPGFEGWGPDDQAFLAKLRTLHGQSPKATGRTTTFWHPAAPREHVETNRHRFRSLYKPLVGNEPAMRELIARQEYP